jgi:hypothetical protein
MDLAMAGVGSSYRLLPTSVLGLAWLQTHFETNTWELICSGAVRLQSACVEELCRDAHQAGLAVFRIPAVEMVGTAGS